MERIRQIEVVRGASSVLYGLHALGGVINIVTRKAQRRFEGDAAVQYRALNRARSPHEPGDTPWLGQRHGDAGWHRHDPYRLDDQQLATSGNGSDEQQLSGRLDARLGARWRLGVAAAYLRRLQTGIDTYDSGAVLDRKNLSQPPMPA